MQYFENFVKIDVDDEKIKKMSKNLILEFFEECKDNQIDPLLDDFLDEYEDTFYDEAITITSSYLTKPASKEIDIFDEVHEFLTELLFDTFDTLYNEHIM